MRVIGITPDGRPIFQKDDGEIFSEKSVTVMDPRINDGRPTNIPTVFSGHELGEDAAADIIVQSGGLDPHTGKRLRGFKDMKSAIRAAERKSEALGRILRALGR